MKKIIKSLFFLFLPLLLGSIVGFIISNYINYADLNKPPFSPPSILFPIIWSAIYLLIGFSYFLFKNENQNNKMIDNVYYLQLFVNITWPILFFVFKFYFLALLWIMFLFILVLWLYNLYKKNKKISAYLLFPYLIWLLFAFYLNAGIYLLN